MEQIASEVLLEASLAQLVKMVPIAERREMLQKIYDSYQSGKKGFCADVARILAESEIGASLEDKSSKMDPSRYRLNTVRIREYITGRNRRVKDDLLWACMCVGLNQWNASEARQIVYGLLSDLKERLVEVERLLGLGKITTEDFAKIPDRLLPTILERAVARVSDEAKLTDFLARKFENAPPLLGDSDLSEIKHRITSSINKRLKGSALLESRDAVASSVQYSIDLEARPSRLDLLRCAKKAIMHARGQEYPGQLMLDTYIANVRQLRKRQSMALIDTAINQCLLNLGFVG